MRLHYKMKICLVLVSILWPAVLFSQVKTVMGSVTDSESKIAIPDANIKYANRTTVGSKKGVYVFSVSDTLTEINIRYSCTGYRTEVRKILLQSASDTIVVNISLTSSLNELPQIDIVGKTSPDTVVGNNRFFIDDFEFYKNDILLLISDKKTNKKSVALANEQHQLMVEAAMPYSDDKQYLYTDYMGNINVIGQEKTYRLKINNQQIFFQEMPYDDFRLMIMPCIDTIGNKIYFSDYRSDYPEFDYYSWQRNDSDASAVHHVINKPLAEMYAFEYEFLPPRLKLYARKLEQQSGVDRYQIAAYMTNFSSSRYFTPLFAPLFIINDTLLIFDHYADKIYHYDTASVCIDSVSITYHHPQKWREWRNNIIKDDTKNSLYGLFLKGSTSYLKQIDYRTGNVTSVSKLEMPYVQRIKIRNGYAYYIYRPHGSLQTKFLYREAISASE
jgi:hypothetical protein